MNIVKQNPQNFNHRGKAAPTILSTIDLIDHEIDYCQEQVVSLTQLASWYSDLAAAHIALRRALAADVTATLAEAEEAVLA